MNQQSRKPKLGCLSGKSDIIGPLLLSAKYKHLKLLVENIVIGNEVKNYFIIEFSRISKEWVSLHSKLLKDLLLY